MVDFCSEQIVYRFTRVNSIFCAKIGANKSLYNRQNPIEDELDMLTKALCTR